MLPDVESRVGESQYPIQIKQVGIEWVGWYGRMGSWRSDIPRVNTPLLLFLFLFQPLQFLTVCCNINGNPLGHKIDQQDPFSVP